MLNWVLGRREAAADGNDLPDGGCREDDASSQLGAEDVEDIVLKRSKRPGSLWLSCALQCFGGRKVVRDLEKRQSRAQMDLRKHSSVTAPGRAASFRSFTAEAPTRPVRRSSATSVRSEAMAKMATAPGRVPSLRSFTAEAQAPARPTRRSSATSARSETVGKKASEGTPSSVRTRPFHPMHLPPVSRPGLPPARSRRDLRPRADEAPESELGDFGAVVAGRAGSRGGLPDIGIRDERLRRVMEARQRRSRRMSQGEHMAPRRVRTASQQTLEEVLNSPNQARELGTDGISFFWGAQSAETGQRRARAATEVGF